MSRRSRPTLGHVARCVLASWLLMWPESAQSQTAEQLQERLSMMRERLQEAETAADIADSIYAARVPAVTISVGPVRGLATPSQEAFARSVLEEAWEPFSERVGSDVAPTQTLVFYVYDQPEGPIVVTDPGWLEVFVDSLDTRIEVVSIVRARIGGELTRALPEPLRSWIGSIPLPVERNKSWSSIYDRLVITPSRVSRSCYEGSVESCWEAFGITEVEPTWDRWYSAADLAARVRARFPGGPQGWGRMDQGMQEPYRDCLAGTSGAQCLRFLAVGNHIDPDVPLGYEVREDLLQYALEAGGPGAYQRARDYHGTDLKETLSLIAGTDADELMASWRDRLMADYATPDPRSGREVLTTLTWVLLLGLAAGRGARWN